jgi:ABC-2 type transport system ATP-binding protein
VDPQVEVALVAEGTRLSVTVDKGDRVLPRLLREVAAQHYDVAAAEVVRPTLDDVFLNLTGRSLREENATNTDQAAEPAPDAAVADITPTTSPASVGASR